MMDDRQISIAATYCIDGGLVEALTYYRKLTEEDARRVTSRMIEIRRDRFFHKKLKEGF